MCQFNFSKELLALIKELQNTNIDKIKDIRFNWSENSNTRIEHIIETGNTLILKQLDKLNELNPANVQYIKNALIYTLALSLIVSPELKDNDAKLKHAWNENLNMLENLLQRKNADYGSSYMNVANKLGVRNTFSVRILDKCNRLEQLQKTHETHVNESSLDTVNDLNGYYILFLLALKEVAVNNK